MPNLLMISIDDLFSISAWPEYAALVQTPNLTAFASGATNFTNAYAAVALCNPSRSAVLSGHNPLRSGIVDNAGDIFQAVPRQDILLARLHDAGYSVALGGKVFHHLADPTMSDFVDQFLNDDGYRGEPKDFAGDPPGTWLTFGPSGDTVMGDAVLAQSVIDFLAQDHPDPFTLAAGIFAPHGPWVVPQQFFDLYDRDSIPVPYFGTDTQGMADFYYALTGSDFHQRVLSHDGWVDLIHAYLAAVSYADYIFGEMIAALDASPYAADTQVVVWSDHGYHLGDRGVWHKFTLWEESGRAPLMIREAGQTEGAVVTTPVSLQDIYPTILDLMGVGGTFRGDGHSLVPLLPGGDPAAFTGEGAFTWMFGGYSLRLGDYRYIHYEDGSEELYNIATDLHQLHNLIADPAAAATLADLRAHLPELPGFDIHIGNPGTDDMVGTAANDLFIVGKCEGAIVGGAGDDRYWLMQASHVVEAAGGGYDSVILGGTATVAPDNVEAIHVRNDIAGGVVHANASNNDIYAIQTDFVFYAEGGNDHFYGYNHADVAYGGDGNDVMAGQMKGDTLYGDAGRDNLYGENGADTLDGGIGNDFLNGGSQADKLYGGGGDDHIVGGLAADLILGGAGRDVVSGGSGGDRIDGGDGSDTLAGGTGNDLLFGGTGNDVIDFGVGSDRATGGIGSDRFVCDVAGGIDTIVDFTVGIDVLDLRAAGFADFDAVKAHAVDGVGYVDIDLGNSTILRLLDVQLDQLVVGDFVLV